MNYDTTFQSLLSHLQQEFQILTKVLYRNTNQHSNTSLFQYLKQLSRKASLYLTIERIELINQCIKECFLYHMETKIISLDIEKISTTLELSGLGLDMMSEMLHLCLKISTILQVLLKKRIFAILYSFFFGLISNIYEKLQQFFDRIYLDYFHFYHLLQHYSIVFPKYSSMIDQQILPSIQLSQKTQQFYQRLQQLSKHSGREDEDEDDTEDQRLDNSFMKSERESIQSPSLDSKEEKILQYIDDLPQDGVSIATPSNSIQKKVLKETGASDDEGIPQYMKHQSTSIKKLKPPFPTTVSSPDLQIMKVKTPASSNSKLKRKLDFQSSSSSVVLQTIPVSTKKRKMNTVEDLSKNNQIPQNKKTSEDDIDNIFSGFF